MPYGRGSIEIFLFHVLHLCIGLAYDGGTPALGAGRPSSILGGPTEQSKGGTGRLSREGDKMPKPATEHE